MTSPTYDDAQRAAATVGPCWGCDHHHPLGEGDAAIGLALARARRAVAALHEAAMAGDEPTMAAARDAALAAYERLWTLLDGYGILSGVAPAGGSETEAPEPEPVDLPAPDAVRAAMGEP